jgi:hypothetical protein
MSFGRSFNPVAMPVICAGDSVIVSQVILYGRHSTFYDQF